MLNCGFSKVQQAGRCAAGKAVFDPDLEQGSNNIIVVRRDPATGEMTCALVHRWCRPDGRAVDLVCAARCLSRMRGNVHVR